MTTTAEMPDQQLAHIAYFQKWHMEYGRAAMFEREMGDHRKAGEHQIKQAECFRIVQLWRDTSAA